MVDYRSRKISIRDENLHKLIMKLSEGRFLIPTFQRPYVWDPESICGLWASIYQHYPIGSILYWKTRTYLHVHRQLGGFFTPRENDTSTDSDYRSYILDGQQRVTSLYVSYFGGPGKIRDRYDFDFTLYFDLKKEEFFFERDYYRHRWDTDSAFLLRLQEVPDLSADYCRYLPDSRPDIERSFAQLKYIFTHYRIPMVRLEGYDVSSVCAIFERINQNGIRLENMDILIARSFDNCDTVVEEDFPVK